MLALDGVFSFNPWKIYLIDCTPKPTELEDDLAKSQSGRFGKEKKRFASTGFQTPNRSARRVITIPIDL
jgi:hypothetical protein